METPFAIVHIAHASVDIPDEVRPQLLLSDAEIKRELGLMTDHFMTRLFALPPELAATVRFPYSCLVVDPKRAIDDSDEPMARRGMGAVYTRTSSGDLLREDISDEQRAALIERYYEPHHRDLNASLEAALEAHGHCLMIDAHSFPSHPLLFESGQPAPRPDISIGTDDFHTPGWLRDIAVEVFARRVARVGLDSPFHGVLVPLSHYRTDERVLAVTIGLNRSLYMDERMVLPLPTFDAFATGFRAGLAQLVEAARAEVD